MLSDCEIKDYFIKPDIRGLLVFECMEKTIDPFDWIHSNKALIEEKILNYGGILLRNFNIQSVSEFNRFIQILYPNLLDYMYRSTPRTKLGGKIYTATEYPEDRSIPLHNENSYSKSWPQKIIFYSVVTAKDGGETPIRKKFEQYGIKYIRNYSRGIDLSWEEVFQTDNKQEVAAFCRLHQIDFQWNTKGPELTTTQICQASIAHPITKGMVWFNQAHLFHISALDINTRHSLFKELGEKNLPRNAFYGNGSVIDIQELEHIRQIYESEKIKFMWQKNDIMILDNLLMAHGREPFSGERKLVVAMA